MAAAASSGRLAVLGTPALGAFVMVHARAVASTMIVLRAIISVAIFIALVGASALVTVALRPVRAAEQRPAIPHLRASIFRRARASDFMTE